MAERVERLFGDRFGMMFGALPSTTTDDDLEWPKPLSSAPYGLVPYGDDGEAQPFPTAQFVTDEWRPFYATDARASVIVLQPNHFNFIPNPALRVSGAGWQVQGFDSDELLADSWVGQSIHAQGAGTIRFISAPAGEDDTVDRYVYVGPSANPLLPWQEYGRSGAEYTFSLYAKGTGYFQLVMTAYATIDPTDSTSAVNPIPVSEVFSPFFTLNATDWERYYVKTTSLLAEVADFTDSFRGAAWVDVKVEVFDPASDAQFSSFMLDASEGPVAEYFDGGMDELQTVDDYLWLGQNDNSISVYYYDRLVRTQWLHTNLFAAVPAGMPVQIFFYDYAHPFIA